MEEDKVLALINRRQRQILVHSYLYYKLNENIWNDSQFDQASVELVQLMKEHSEKAKESQWYNDFKDWDGSSGFDLPFTNESTISAAYRTLREYGLRVNIPMSEMFNRPQEEPIFDNVTIKKVDKPKKVIEPKVVKKVEVKPQTPQPKKQIKLF
jgi:hypothetical protein